MIVCLGGGSGPRQLQPAGVAFPLELELGLRRRRNWRQAGEEPTAISPTKGRSNQPACGTAVVRRHLKEQGVARGGLEGLPRRRRTPLGTGCALLARREQRGGLERGSLAFVQSELGGVRQISRYTRNSRVMAVKSTGTEHGAPLWIASPGDPSIAKTHVGLRVGRRVPSPRRWPPNIHLTRRKTTSPCISKHY